MKTLYQIFLLSGLLFLAACDRDDSFEGPDLNDLYGEFAVLEELAVSSSTADFSSGEDVFFTARFSKISNWTLTITSIGNGAQKIISGSSKALDATNASWNGSTSVFPSFNTGPCTATLFVGEDSTTYSTSLTVTGVRQPDGIVVADFENGIDPGWNMFVQSGANMSFVPAQNELVPQGDFYFDMGGEVGWDWLIGLIDFPASAYGNDGFELGNDPSNLYFNMLVYKPDTIDNGIVLMQFKEDDNGDGSFSESSEDLYAIELADTELTNGWQVISVKYSDLVSLTNGQPADPNGNQVHNPESLHTISCLFLANPSSGYSQNLIDFIIFTYDEPLVL